MKFPSIWDYPPLWRGIRSDKHMRMCSASTGEGSQFESDTDLHPVLQGPGVSYLLSFLFLTVGKDRPAVRTHGGNTALLGRTGVTFHRRAVQFRQAPPSLHP